FVVERSTRLFVAWTAFGIADLVTAVTLGVLYSNSPIGVLRGDLGTELMATLPMCLVPAFGVPVTLVAHVLSLSTLAERGAAAGGPARPRRGRAGRSRRPTGTRADAGRARGDQPAPGPMPAGRGGQPAPGPMPAGRGGQPARGPTPAG